MTHDPHLARARSLVEAARKARYYPYQIVFVEGAERISYEVGWRDNEPVLYRKEVIPFVAYGAARQEESAQ